MAIKKQVKTTEERIREYYVAEDGEWLVEKGKVKEAKLLKEACSRIEELKREVERANERANGYLQEKWDLEDPLKKEIWDLEKRVLAAESNARQANNRLMEVFDHIDDLREEYVRVE